MNELQAVQVVGDDGNDETPAVLLSAVVQVLDGDNPIGEVEVEGITYTVVVTVTPAS